MTDQITITDVGPIEHVTIPVPEGGGLVIFKGVNGSGKSIALEAIDAAVTGKGRVPVRDGQMRGEVNAHGVTLRLGRSTRRKGEAEVTSLEGRLSVADLVDPGIKEPQAADAHRIRALVSLAAGEPNIALFGDLMPHGQVLDFITPHAQDAKDLVTMATRVKRDIEAAARQEEATAETAKREADAAGEAAGGADPAWAKPEAEVNQALEQAIERRSTLKARAEAAERIIQTASEATQALQMSEQSWTGPTLADAVGHREDCGVKLREAELTVSRAIAELKAAHEAAKAAEDHEAVIAAWRKSIDVGCETASVTPEDLTAADRAVEETRDDVELSGDGRRAVEHVKKRNDAENLMKAAESRAQQLRDAAAGADEVLSEVILASGVPLRVEPINQQMRLVLQTSRGRTPFGELSPGERWRIALDIAAKALGAGGELTIPQEAWEAMDPANQEAVVNQLKETGIIAYTAEASWGSLRAEQYGDSDT